jgi:HD-like signal output (HDOD) protein
MGFHILDDRFNELRIAIQAALPKLNVSRSCELSTHEWILFEEVVKILNYFEKVTKALSEDYATLADAIPLGNCLFKALDGVQSKNPAVNFFTQNLKFNLNERLDNLEENEHYVLATAFDP